MAICRVLKASLRDMEGRYDDTAKFLTACLTDVKKKIVTITRSDGDAMDEQLQVKNNAVFCACPAIDADKRRLSR
jgi:hypothetical protein